MQILTVNISQTMTDRAIMTTAPKIILHVGFRLAYLKLTSSKGQVGLDLF